MLFRKVSTLSAILGVLLFLPRAGSAQATKGQNSADDQELFKYVLTMDKIQKLSAATHGLMDLAKAHPEMNGDASGSPTIDVIVQKIQKYPDAVALLTKNGLTARDFAAGSLTLLQAGMAVGMKKAGMYKDYPTEMLKMVSGPNLMFVEQHYDEIVKAMPELSPMNMK